MRNNGQFLLVFAYVGPAVSLGELNVLFEIAVRYRAEEKHGKVRFSHVYCGGSVESKGESRLGDSAGTRFEITLETGQEVSVLLPYRFEDVRVAKSAVEFHPANHSKTKPIKKMKEQNAPTSVRLQ